MCSLYKIFVRKGISPFYFVGLPIRPYSLSCLLAVSGIGCALAFAQDGYIECMASPAPSRAGPGRAGAITCGKP